MNMDIEVFVKVYCSIGMVVFFGCLLTFFYSWIRLAYYLPKLRKALGKYSNKFKFKFFDFYSLQGNGWDITTTAQHKNNEIIFGTEFSIDPEVAQLKKQCSKYYKRLFYSIFSAFISFAVFFGWIIFKMTTER